MRVNRRNLYAVSREGLGETFGRSNEFSKIVSGRALPEELV